MTQANAPRPRKIPPAGDIALGAVRLFLSVVPIIGGTALLCASSATLPIVLGLAAISSGVYGTIGVIKKFVGPRPERQPKSPVGVKLKKWLNDPQKRRAFKIKTALGVAIGAVRCATGLVLAANLGALIGAPLFGIIAATAAGLSVVGCVTAVGSLVTLGVFSVFTAPKRLEKINTRKAKPAASADPSKLNTAAAKTEFNASATNDNTVRPKPNAAKPDSPAP